MFFGKLPRFFCEDENDDKGGGGGGAPPDPAAAEAKLTAARAAAKEAGTFVVNDWREAVDKEDAVHPSLASYKDLKAVVKSHINAQKLIGGDKIPIPKEDDAAGWEALYNKIGRPEGPEKYEFQPLGDGEAPEGWQGMDPEFEKAFRKEMHAAGFTKKQAGAMWKSLQGRAVEQYKGIMSSTTERLSKEHGELKEEWGGAYPEKLKIAQRAADAIEKLGVKGLNAWLKSSGAGREPIVMRMMAIIGEQAGEEKLGPGSHREKFTPREAEAKANSIIFDKSNPEHEAYVSGRDPRHNEVVQKVQGLLGQTN